MNNKKNDRVKRFSPRRPSLPPPIKEVNSECKLKFSALYFCFSSVLARCFCLLAVVRRESKKEKQKIVVKVVIKSGNPLTIESHESLHAHRYDGFRAHFFPSLADTSSSRFGSSEAHAHCFRASRELPQQQRVFVSDESGERKK